MPDEHREHQSQCKQRFETRYSFHNGSSPFEIFKPLSILKIQFAVSQLPLECITSFLKIEPIAKQG